MNVLYIKMYEMQWLIVASEIDKNCFLNECLKFMPFALKKIVVVVVFYFHVFVFEWWGEPKGLQLPCACAILQITRVAYDCLYSWQWKVKQRGMATIVSLHGFDFCSSRGIVMSHTNILISWVQFASLENEVHLYSSLWNCHFMVPICLFYQTSYISYF